MIDSIFLSWFHFCWAQVSYPILLILNYFCLSQFVSYFPLYQLFSTVVNCDYKYYSISSSMLFFRKWKDWYFRLIISCLKTCFSRICYYFYYHDFYIIFCFDFHNLLKYFWYLFFVSEFSLFEPTLFILYLLYLSHSLMSTHYSIVFGKQLMC